MEQNYDCESRFDPETIVKTAWTRLVPWFTERHGVRSGQLQIGDGESDGHNVTFKWTYENEYEPPTQGEMCADAPKGGDHA
jgi:hypothetical protein